MTTAQKNVLISQKLVALMNQGMQINEAFDSLFGAGAYIKFAGEIYQELRAKQGL